MARRRRGPIHHFTLTRRSRRARRRYRRNPREVHVHAGGRRGMSTGTLLLIGGAVLFLTPLGSQLFRGGLFGVGTGVLPGVPPGYTAIGGGYYMGPNGQTYIRTAAGMVPSAAPGASTGVTPYVPLIGAGIQGLTSLLNSLFSPRPTTATPTGGTVPLSPIPSTSLGGGVTLPSWYVDANPGFTLGGGGGLSPIPDTNLGGYSILPDWYAEANPVYTLVASDGNYPPPFGGDGGLWEGLA